MWSKILERLTSPVVVAAIVAQIVSILLMVGVIDAGLGDTINKVGAGVCELMVLFGIFNNPADKTQF